MTEAEALARARGGQDDAPAFSVLVPYRDVAAANAALAANAIVHPDRMVWLITVRADGMTRSSIAALPQLKHRYSLIIDAEMGRVTDMCIGCEAVRDGHLVVVPTQRGADLSDDPTAGPQALPGR
jgi:hypothetical protein